MLLEERVGQPTTEAEAERLALELYGLHVAAKALPGEYDDNFHLKTTDAPAVGAEVPLAGAIDAAPVASSPLTFTAETDDESELNFAVSDEDGATDADAVPAAEKPQPQNENPWQPPAGTDFVLKVMHPARDPALIDLQCQALQHLAQRAPQIGLPRVCLNKLGEAFTTIVGQDGSPRLVWLLTYIPGTLMAHANPHSAEMLRSLGELLGELSSGLAHFSHGAAKRELKWDFAQAGWIREHLDQIADPERRALLEKFIALYDSEVVPVMSRLRRSVVYGDANDYNVLVGNVSTQPRRVVSVFDFGDMHESFTVSEVATAAAYSILGKKEPLRAAAAVLSGYYSRFLLTDVEISVLYPLIAMRLAVSVVNSAIRASVKPDDSYVTITEEPAWEALTRLARVHPRFAHYTLREVCGLQPVPKASAVRKWLAAHAGSSAPILDVDVRTTSPIVFDLGVGSAFLGADPSASESEKLSEAIFGELRKAKLSVGVGRYNEPRLLYSSALFGATENPTDERRTIHLGVDLFVAAGSSVYSPLNGVVHAFANNPEPLDYGPVVILRHGPGGGEEFFTLYGHLTRESLGKLKIGQTIVRGERIGRIGAMAENGGWPPHLHFQVITDLLDRGTDFPGVALAAERGVWAELSPSPNLLLRIAAEGVVADEKDVADTLADRERVLGGNLSVSYRRPLKIVRGWKQYLYDETGRAYLDVYNNVPLVGHSHPRVARAVAQQIGLLNTNTRYLHDNVVRYAERLLELMPPSLRVCYFVNSGSEANELALRLARAHTKREDVIVLEHAYHGHTSSLIDLSPYKFNGPGGRGQKPWVHVAPLADDYRGAYKRGEAGIGTKYAERVGDVIANASSEGRAIAAFLAETLPSVAGQIVFPAGYLDGVYQRVRAAGGVCIADEVQVGFGRLGTHFWGFETQRVVPDIVVLGKPIGNAFPLAAVVTTHEIAASFANGMEFFSTFGGNPVSCAAGLAVLDVLREEKLTENALRVGEHLLKRLRGLQERHAVIGDVRGSGLFLGVDLVRDRDTRVPATAEADYVVNRLRERGVLAGTDGPGHNVIKLRPPLIFSKADADLFVDTLDLVLTEDAAQVPRAQKQAGMAAQA
ncbi:MAG TPA: aminotransferase class III-fold pyridoxal phosphate-dependent enzyme [Candidatus Acidoferrum sp.]|jgi:4-aminobutyrate aminotransferase-like enzyme/Ser/Thr protein kinase RdoA (MazF antagonist)